MALLARPLLHSASGRAGGARGGRASRIARAARVNVFGVSIVRNESDIIRIHVLHHLAIGLDRILVVDNGSSDGTDRILGELSRDGRVRWTSDSGPFRQEAVLTELAREAFRAGADWVVPLDADEFWCAPGRDLRSVLAASGAAALRVNVVNFIQRREQLTSTPEGLLHMTHRVAEPVPGNEEARRLMAKQRLAFVELAFRQKWIVRPSDSVAIAWGSHRYWGVDGPAESTDEIACLHAPIRSRGVMQAKAERAARMKEARAARTNEASVRHKVPHWRRWLDLSEEDKLDEEWAANSYADGCIDVYGERRPVIFDSRLRDAVAPWITRPLWKRLLARVPVPGGPPR